MPEFNSFDACTISYSEVGAGPAVVLLHGAMVDTSLNWEASGVLDRLTAAGYRVIAPDARGHGSSAKPHDPSAYADRALVKDVTALLDHLSLDEVALVGYSMGADTAVRVAAQDRRVVALVAGGVGGDLSDPPGYDPSATANAIRGNPTDPKLAGGGSDHVASIAGLAVALGGDTTALAALYEGVGAQRSPHFETVSCPALVITGDRDDMAGGTAEDLAQHLPRAEAVTLANLDHLGAVFDPQFADAVVAFLAAGCAHLIWPHLGG